MDVDPVPEEMKCEHVPGGRRLHPFAIYHMGTRPHVEVAHLVSDERDHILRHVLIEDGEYDVCVRGSALDEYGYELQPEERLSDGELDAITLKQQSMRDKGGVSLAMVRDQLEQDPPQAAVGHLIIATYYAAKADPEVDQEGLERIRERMHEQTNHIDPENTEAIRERLDQSLR